MLRPRLQAMREPPSDEGGIFASMGGTWPADVHMTMGEMLESGNHIPAMAAGSHPPGRDAGPCRSSTSTHWPARCRSWS